MLRGVQLAVSEVNTHAVIGPYNSNVPVRILRVTPAGGFEVLFDALVLPDGAAGVKALQKVGQTLEFIKDTYRHCKTILAIGESRVLLQAAGTPAAQASGARHRSPACLVSEVRQRSARRADT